MPLCETFPYTFDTNRSKSYYSNINLENGLNVNFQDVVGNISTFLNKIGNKNDNKTVVIVDNLSTIAIENSKFPQEFNILFNYCAENVNIY